MIQFTCGKCGHENRLKTIQNFVGKLKPVRCEKCGAENIYKPRPHREYDKY